MNKPGGPKPKCRKRDLVSLVWSMNSCYSRLIAGIPPDVTVDTMASTWTFQGQTHRIGGHRRYPCADVMGHPIGVYDRTKMKDLEQMKNDIEWVKERNRPASDDM